MRPNEDVEQELDNAWAATFGHTRDRLFVYRAAYALITACCFGTDLSEGHFSWCIDMLNRIDVHDAIEG